METPPSSPPTLRKTFPLPDPKMNLASFMNPISDLLYDQDTTSRYTPGSPETYIIYDKMSLNLVHVARDIARFNYICGTQIFRKDGRLVWVIIDEAGDATITRLDKGKLRIILSLEGSTWIRDGKDAPTPSWQTGVRTKWTQDHPHHHQRGPRLRHNRQHRTRHQLDTGDSSSPETA